MLIIIIAIVYLAGALFCFRRTASSLYSGWENTRKGVDVGLLAFVCFCAAMLAVIWPVTLPGYLLWRSFNVSHLALRLTTGLEPNDEDDLGAHEDSGY